jgi:hypothetical protein
MHTERTLAELNCGSIFTTALSGHVATRLKSEANLKMTVVPVAGHKF